MWTNVILALIPVMQKANVSMNWALMIVDVCQATRETVSMPAQVIYNFPYLTESGNESRLFCI